MAVAEALEPTTEYVACAQNRMVPSKALRWSPAVHHDPQLVKMHAVSVDEGEAAELTVCTHHHSRDLQAGGKAFDQVALSIRCPWCADALDVIWT